ncbi:SRPBCC domain-containing protein [Dactylosporangium sp. NPDC051541]|uniref:SRPBCC domain-containing protein n=1 Tax=Dactylosporangium sp. NPDC051541 TaxID=3363977 RepID=UPI0037897D9F
MTDLSTDAFYPHPPAKVWRALTEPDLIARWLMPGDFRLEAGHRYSMRVAPMPAAGFSARIEAEVLGFDPERELRVAWRDAVSREAWALTWTLHPDGHGTRLFPHRSGGPGLERAALVMSDAWERPGRAGRRPGRGAHRSPRRYAGHAGRPRADRPPPAGRGRWGRCRSSRPCPSSEAWRWLVHTWDLARATGGDETLDPAQVARVHAAAEPSSAGLVATGAFRAPVPAPAGADAQTRLPCFAGRRP